MPIEYTLLAGKPFPFETCPKCNKPITYLLMRGTVQRWKRVWYAPWRTQDYCAVICSECSDIIGWESPDVDASTVETPSMESALDVIDRMDQARMQKELELRQKLADLQESHHRLHRLFDKTNQQREESTRAVRSAQYLLDVWCNSGSECTCDEADRGSGSGDDPELGCLSCRTWSWIEKHGRD